VDAVPYHVCTSEKRLGKEKKKKKKKTPCG
jgi:hypothetical protein